VTILILAVVGSVLILSEFGRPKDQAYYNILALLTAIFAVSGGWTLWASITGHVARKHILTGLLLTVLSLTPLAIMHEQLFGLRYRPVFSPCEFLVWFTAGIGLAKPATMKQLISIAAVINLSQREQGEKRRGGQLRKDWLADAQKNVLMPMTTHVVNDFLGEDYDKLLVEQDSEGLKKLHDLKLAIPTRSERRVFGTMDRSDGGSIAIAGPRGAGKSTLLRVVCDGRRTGSSSTKLAIYASAPAEYIPRDFLVELFQRVCEVYITARGYTVDRTAAHRFILRKRTARVIRDALWTLFRVVLALGLTALFIWTVRVGAKETLEPAQKAFDSSFSKLEKRGKYVWDNYRWICQMALLLIALIVWPPRRTWRYLRWHAEPSGVTRAREHLLRLQVERTTTWGLNANLPGFRGATVGLTKGGSLKYLPWSFPELVRNFRTFMERISREARANGGHIIIAIDEVDRIGSVEQAERFVSEIKAIFGIENCFYIVSVAEEVGSAFARRAVIGRSVFENAFDDVIVIDPLSLDESRKLLLRRVPGFTPSFAFLTHSLSGGVPRELIRVTRRLVEINLEESDAGRPYPRLDDLAAALIKEEMTETLTGMRTQLSSMSAGVDLGGIFDSMRGLIRTMELALPCDMTPALPQLYDFARLDLNPLRDAPEDGPTRAVLVQLSAFAFFCLTVLEVFEDGVFELDRAKSESDGSSPASFEELAAARRELSVSPSSCRATLARFRVAWGLPQL
jgi:hypothetical protein